MTTTTEQEWLSPTLFSHPTAAALLRAVVTTPGDDTPRLVYADWLEEQGEAERAEFIRVQCAFEKLASVDRTCPFLDNHGQSQPRWAEGACQCEGCVLHRRERKLLCSNFDKWHNLPNDPHGCTWDMQNFDDGDPEPEAQLRALFSRGFVSRVRCSCRAWLDHGAAIVAANPVEQVWLQGRQPTRTSEAVAQFPQFWGWAAERVNFSQFIEWPHSESRLPEALFDALDGWHQGLPEFYPLTWKFYTTREAALMALSSAALALARKQAGLSELSRYA